MKQIYCSSYRKKGCSKRKRCRIKLTSEKLKTIIEIVMVGLTLLSVVLVGCSNYEMKRQRESAYKPVLAINETKLSFEGQVYGAYEDGSSYTDLSLVKKTIESIPMLKFKVENIGLGTAKNIRCEWDKENYNNFINHFKESDINEVVIDEDGDCKIAKYGDLTYFKTNLSQSNEIIFLKTDNSEDNYFELDATVYGYLCALQAILGYNTETQPELILNISYEDVYSKQYEAVVNIKYEINEKHIDGEYQCIITYKPNIVYSE